jgi:hypothetical protein
VSPKISPRPRRYLQARVGEFRPILHQGYVCRSSGRVESHPLSGSRTQYWRSLLDASRAGRAGRAETLPYSRRSIRPSSLEAIGILCQILQSRESGRRLSLHREGEALIYSPSQLYIYQGQPADHSSKLRCFEGTSATAEPIALEVKACSRYLLSTTTKHVMRNRVCYCRLKNPIPRCGPAPDREPARAPTNPIHKPDLLEHSFQSPSLPTGPVLE